MEDNRERFDVAPEWDELEEAAVELLEDVDDPEALVVWVKDSDEEVYRQVSAMETARSHYVLLWWMLTEETVPLTRNLLESSGRFTEEAAGALASEVDPHRAVEIARAFAERHGEGGEGMVYLAGDEE